MTIFSLLYASRSILAPDEAEAAVQTIVSGSQVRNAKADVTGCLIFSGSRFAQILEGDRAAVECIMDSIRRDPRHTDISVLEEGSVTGRRFLGWALGYAGPSLYVQRLIAAPAADALRGSRDGIAELTRVMSAFAPAHGQTNC